MRLWIAVFLLVLLPLQFSLAAWGMPAPHEGRAVPGVHCPHPHVNADAIGLDASAASHADCGTCHNGCPLALFHESPSHPASAAVFPLTAAGVLPTSRPGDQPDRPQWTARG